jgi:hypothetical protein
LKTVVFLGPSLAIDEARRTLDAIYLPPVRQADLVSAAINYRPDVIGIIDGEFMQSLSVWHKEILYVLDCGIRLYGASSMGALRAAEAADFGMVGVGEIYRMYSEGVLQDDDEVALVYGPQGTGYIKASEPMVNVRATILAANSERIVSDQDSARLIAVAKGLYFADRTFPTIFAKAAESVPADVLRRVSQFAVTDYVDLKAKDAMLLLETIRDLPDPLPPRQEKTFEFISSYQFETLFNRDRLVRKGDTEIPLEAIANHVALHHSDFHDLNFNALNRTLAVILARLVEVEASEEDIEVEEQRFRVRHSLSTDEFFAAWLDRNHLRSQDFHSLMKDVALCRRLHRWLLTARWMDRNTKSLLDELRLTNQYTNWVDRAASHEQLVASGKGMLDAIDPLRLSTNELLVEHEDRTGFQMDCDVSMWVEDAGFHSRGNLKTELLRAKVARASLLKLIAESLGGADKATA